MREMTVYERLREARKALKLNQRNFSKQIGLTQTSLSMIEVGTNILTDKNIKLICATFNVREEWLREGKGQMFNDSPYIKEVCDILGDLTPDTQKSLLVIARELLKVEKRQAGDTEDSTEAMEDEEAAPPPVQEKPKGENEDLKRICEEIHNEG